MHMPLHEVEGEVGAREGAVGAARLVEHGDVRRDPALLDQEGQVLGRAVGAVGDEALRLEPKRSSTRSIMVRAAPTSAWRMARLASTSRMIA